MARPTDDGIDYFFLDVDMFEDDKLHFVIAKHGLAGRAVIVSLLMALYRKGYAMPWAERDRIIFASKIGADIRTVETIVSDAINEGFFRRDVYEKAEVLTSHGIQKRWLEATRKRKNGGHIPAELRCFENIPPETPQSSAGNPSIVGVPAESRNRLDKIRLDKKKEEEREDPPTLAPVEDVSSLVSRSLRSVGADPQEAVAAEAVSSLSVFREPVSPTAPARHDDATAGQPEPLESIDPFMDQADRLLCEPAGQDWTRTSAWVGSQRRPMRKYAKLWFNTGELASILRLYHGKIPPKEYHRAFAKAVVQAQDKDPSKIAPAKWMLGYIYQSVLDDLRKEKQLEQTEARRA